MKYCARFHPCASPKATSAPASTCTRPTSPRSPRSFGPRAQTVHGLKDLGATLGEHVADRARRPRAGVAGPGRARRAELCALDVEDLEPTARGLLVRVRSSKTDQEGHGELVGVPFDEDPAPCPVRAVRAWLDAAAITTGAVFRRLHAATPSAPGGSRRNPWR